MGGYDDNYEVLTMDPDWIDTFSTRSKVPLLLMNPNLGGVASSLVGPCLV